MQATGKESRSLKHNIKATCLYCRQESAMKSKGKIGNLRPRYHPARPVRFHGELVIQSVRLSDIYTQDKAKCEFCENICIFLQLVSGDKTIPEPYYFSRTDSLDTR